MVMNHGGWHIADVSHPENMVFIAAANPTAILELLDLLDTRNRRIDELLAERNATGVAIDRALAGHVPDEHPMRSRLLMLANMAGALKTKEHEA